MNLPKGNKLFEKQPLNSNDIKILTDNLAKNKFSGYINLEINTANMRWRGILFYSLGLNKTSFEIDNNNNFKLMKSASRVLGKVKNSGAVVSVYIFSPKIVDVLSNFYLFSDIANREPLKRKEFGKLLDECKDTGMYSIMEIEARGSKNLLVMEQGNFISDPCAEYFGDILTNQEQIDEFVAFVTTNGGTITRSGINLEDMRRKEAEAQRILQLEKELGVIVAGGFFASNDIKIDEITIGQWGLGKKAGVDIEITTHKGLITTTKCIPGKGMTQGTISIPQAFCKSLNVNNGELITVRPLI